MAVSIDWAAKIIYVPKADMTLIQATPVEVRELSINSFRLELKSLESAEPGMPYLDTHQHNPPVDVGGVTLARVVEIINGYTITFEDGQYAVNLIGANSNIGDVVNVNQVSIRTGNSAGLVTSAAIEYGEYGGAVTVDIINGETGTIYPVGTLRRPVNNVVDAMLIATYRGFSKINVLGNLTLSTGDIVDNMTIVGQNPSQTTLTIDTDASTTNIEVEECLIQGVLDGNATLNHCDVGTITYVNGHISNSMIVGPITLGGGATAYLIDCFSAVPGSGAPVIDMGGSGQSLAVRNYSGGVDIRNKTGSEAVTLEIDPGQIILADTCTGGTIVCRGVSKLTDNSGLGCTVVDETVSPKSIWSYTRV